jgi:hypothetical protein
VDSGRLRERKCRKLAARRRSKGSAFDKMRIPESDRRKEVDESKRHAIQFLEKEIKTYKALALFLSKEEIKKHLRVRDGEGLIRPTYYKERMQEAKKLIRELRKPV